MGVVYFLYERKSREYLPLGKRRGDQFEADAEALARFVARQIDRHGVEPTGERSFEVWSDAGDLPHERESGWTCVGEPPGHGAVAGVDPRSGVADLILHENRPEAP